MAVDVLHFDWVELFGNGSGGGRDLIVKKRGASVGCVPYLSVGPKVRQVQEPFSANKQPLHLPFRLQPALRISALYYKHCDS